MQPKHLLATALVALLSGGSGFGIMGYVAAQERAEALEFEVAAPHVGDRVRYSVHQAGAGEREFEFAWLDEQAARRQDGTSVWVARLSVATAPPGAPEQSLWVESGTADVVATQLVQALNRTVAYNPLLPTDESIDFDHRFFTEGYLLPCVIRLPIQGRTIAIGSVTPAWACEQAAEGAPMRATGMATGSPARLLVESGADGGEGLQWVFRSGLAYPESFIQRLPDATIHWNLTHFHAGSGDFTLDPRAGPEAMPLPPLAFAPRTNWLLDDAGVQHPFPLSTAYAFALAAPRWSVLRDFVAENPGAYPAAAFYMDTQEPQAHARRWKILMTDGDDELGFSVERRTPKIGEQEVPQAAQTEAFQENLEGMLFPGMVTVAPQWLPTEFPTVASLWAQWEVIRDPEYLAKPPTFWGFRVGCYGEAGCHDVDTFIDAGYGGATRNLVGPVPAPFVATSQEWSSEGRWHNATLESVTEMRVSYRPALVPPADPETPALVSLEAFVAPSRPDWVVPSVAAAGISSLVAALLYWMWPAIKGLPIWRMFSRIAPDELLRHPVRAVVMAAIEAQPGIHMRELVRKVGRGNGTVEHHLLKLASAGLVVSHVADGYTCYFPRGTDRRRLAAAPILKSEVARAILLAAQTRPGTLPSVLAREIGVSAPTVSYHLRRLEAAGLVVSVAGVQATADGMQAG